MPYSIVHLELWNKKSKQLNLSKKENLDFLAWNIIVDISYNINSYWYKDISRDDTHYHTWQNYFVDFPDNFIKKENIKINYLIYWYYYHLLVDMFWRDNEFPWRILDDSIHKAYQISRKINAKIDFDNFDNFNNTQLINDLYNYDLSWIVLPSVLNKIPLDIIQKSYIDIIDYMTFKKTFSKWDTDKKYMDLVQKYFSYNHYTDLKNKAFESINKKIEIL